METTRILEEDLVVSWSSSIDGELILDTSPDADGLFLIMDICQKVNMHLNLEWKIHREKSQKSNWSCKSVVQMSYLLAEILSPETRTGRLCKLVIRSCLKQLDQIPTFQRLELSAVWSSDKDGELGSSQVTSSGEFSFTTNALSANDHVVTLTVTDEVGAYCRDEVVLFIGSAPTAVITEPLSGDVFSVGEDVLFHGTTTDVEDSMNELTTSWESSQDGVLSSGTPNSQGSSSVF